MITGQDRAVDQFASAWRRGALHHAWLLAGQKGVGKATFAREAATRVLAEADDGELPEPLGIRDVQHHHLPHEVGLHVDVGVLERVAYAGLRREVQHAVGLLVFTHARKRRSVRNIELAEAERIAEVDGAPGDDPEAAGDLGRAQDRGDAQVAVGAARRPDADVLVGEADVERLPVGLRVDRDGADAELLAGAQQAYAAGTNAGTEVTSVFTVNYQVGGVDQAELTPSYTTFVVDRRVNVAIIAGPALAGTIRRQLAEGSGVGTDGARTPAVNMLTGEILDS